MEAPPGAPGLYVVIRTTAEFVSFVSSKLPGRWIFRGQPFPVDPVPIIDRSQARKSRFGVSRDYHEQQLLETFQRLAIPYLDPLPEGAWEWLAVARHYGLPTRLLDWAEHALAALYFAVEDPNDEADSVVYGFRYVGDPSLPDDPFSVEELRVYRPPHVAPRIGAQAGCFSVHPDEFHSHDPDTAEPIPAWPERWPGRTATIRVDAACRVGIRHELRVLGVHRAVLFPDADGVAAHVARILCALKDEETTFDLMERTKELAEGAPDDQAE